MEQDTLIIHPSRNPKIFFAGGDLGGQDSQKKFDGIIAFVAEKYRPSNLRRFCMSTITCPKVVFGLNNNSCPELKKIPSMIFYALNILTKKGCRNIGFHGALPSDGDYVDGAEASLKAIEIWLARHPGAVDSITLVDSHDDYFNLFINDVKSEFELFFENDFKRHCPQWRRTNHHGITDRKQIAEDMKSYDRLYLATAVTYVSAIPQLVAIELDEKAPSVICDIIDCFCKDANWPFVDCVMGGPMHPDAVLKEGGMFPDEKDIQKFIRLLQDETGFFIAMSRDIILESRFPSILAITVPQRIESFVNEYCQILADGKTAPNYLAIF